MKPADETNQVVNLHKCIDRIALTFALGVPYASIQARYRSFQVRIFDEICVRMIAVSISSNYSVN